MSRRHLSPCSEPGCPELTTRSSGRCDRHERARRRAQDATRGNWRERGYDHEYERNRRLVLAEESHCWVCGQPVDKALPGTHRDGPSADHVIRREDGGTNSRDNLRLAHLRCNTGRRAAADPATRPDDATPTTPTYRSVNLS